MTSAELRRRLIRPGLRAVPTPRANPFALGYLALLLGTTLYGRLGDPETVHRLQSLSSTDAHNLLVHPALSLVGSGLWVAGPVWMPYFWAFALTVAPLERRVGGLRALGVFGAGHVAATLLSQAVVVAAVATGRAGKELLDAMDIGVSYGVLASLGALAGLLGPVGRRTALGAGVALVGHQLVTDPDLVTSVGHPAALAVGVSLWPLLRGRGPRPPWRARRARRAPAWQVRSRPETASVEG
ncbi:rhomboid-like protein [Kitasatospora sp. NPDC090308]|uniref:rhomboid-like protein n=1 Tax=Kitasatospora sp. NPDC090308 TaxID=3364082 RepID=UPI0037F50E51